MRIESAIGERHVPMDTMQAPDPEWDIGWSRQNPHGTFAVTTPSVHSGGSHVNGEVIVEFGLSGQVKEMGVSNALRQNLRDPVPLRQPNPEIVVERKWTY